MGIWRWLGRGQEGATQRPRAVSAPSFEPLEPRLLLSADLTGMAAPLASYADAVPQAISVDLDIKPAELPDSAAVPIVQRSFEAASLRGPATGAEMAGTQVVFVDSALEPKSWLENADFAGVTVVRLDAGADGIRRISDVLAACSDLSAVHIFSHGAAGRVSLGTAELTVDSLDDYAADLALWGRSLAQAGDISFYGCSVARGDTGRDLIRRIGELTGADVAASNDPTGPARLGGDWILEVATGPVEAPSFAPAIEFVVEGLLAAGDLDAGFSGGIVTLAIGSASDYAYAVAVQPDGKIVVAGYSTISNNDDFAVARFLADGTLDTSFSGDGIVTTPIGSSRDQASSVAIQADGKIVVAGYGRNSSGNNDFAVARYNPDGTLDTTFSDDGVLLTPIGGFNDYGRSVAIQDDDKIVVAGYSSIDGNNDFAVARYHPDGTLDTSFSNDGIVTTPVGASSDCGRSVAIQPDGKIVVAGHSRIRDSSENESDDFALVRYNLDGTLDGSFAAGGKLTIAVGPSNDCAYSVALQDDGRIVIAGYSQTASGYDFALARCLPDGTPDTSFAGPGAPGLITSIGPGNDYIQGVALQPDGKIVVAGYSRNSDGNDDLALARYLPDGSLDTSFSADGIQTTDIDSDNDYGYAIALQADGKIVVAGSTRSDSNYDLALVRYEGDPVASGPTDIGLSHAAVAENAPAGTPVGTLTCTDATPDDSHTYTLAPGDGADDNASFTINADAPELLTAEPFNYEIRATYSVRVRVTDAAGLWYEEVFTITITNVNDAPSVSLANPTTSLPEDADTTGRTRLADIVLTDDALGTNILTLAGPDAGLFEIDPGAPGTLYLKAGVALDHESQSQLDVTVAVNDPAIGATPDDVAALSVTVTDVNEAPGVSLANMTASLAENTDLSVRLKVADIVVTDDALGTNVLSLSGADAGLFEIDPGAPGLYLKAGTVLDHETNPALDATVAVDDADVGATPDGTAELSIIVTDVNEAPTVALASTTTSLAEDTDTSSRIKVADIEVTDDGMGTLVLSLSGIDAALFEINGSALFLQAGAVLDHGTNPALDVTVEVDDAAVGGTPDGTADLSIAVTDVNDAPTIASDAAVSAFENQTGVLDVESIDPDGEAEGSGLTYSLTGGADQTLFSLSIGTGLLSFKLAPDFEHPVDSDANGVYEVQVTVTDGGGLTDVQAIAVTVHDINEAPTGILLSASTVYEHADTSGGHVVGVLSATDPDTQAPFNTLTFSIQGGADAARFSLDGPNHLVLTDGLLDYEAPTDTDGDGTYEVIVRVTDGGTPGLTHDEAIAVLVVDVNEAPVISGISGQIVAEGADFATIRLDDCVSDVDNGDSELTWTCSGHTALTVLIVDRLATVVAPVDWNGSETLTFTACDPDGLSGSTAAVFTVTAVNDVPAATDDNYSTNEDAPLSVSAPGVLGNDSDADGDALTVSIVTGVSHGALVLQADGSFIYTPQADFHGSDSFVYETSDASGATDTATVYLTVGSVNDAPTLRLSDVTVWLAESTDTTLRLAMATIEVTDDDVGTNVVSLSGADAGLFEIEGAVVYLRAGVALDHEGNPQLEVTIEVDDATIGGEPDAAAGVVIAVLDRTAPVVTVTALTTPDRTPALDGTVDDPTAVVEVTVAGRAYVATNEGDGTWTLADDTISPALNDGIYDVDVTATDAAGNTGSDASVDELEIVADGSSGPAAVDGRVSVSLDGMRYERRTGQTHVQIVISNTSEMPIAGPLWWVLLSVSDPAVPLAGADGTTGEGHPYVDLTEWLGDECLGAGESVSVWVSFTNPLRQRLTFAFSIWGVCPTDGGDGFVRQVTLSLHKGDRQGAALSTVRVRHGSRGAAQIAIVPQKPRRSGKEIGGSPRGAIRPAQVRRLVTQETSLDKRQTREADVPGQTGVCKATPHPGAPGLHISRTAGLRRVEFVLKIAIDDDEEEEEVR